MTDPTPGTRTRSCYINLPDLLLLRTWALDIDRMFDGCPYLVGSAITRPDYRDVDVRVILDDAQFDALASACDILRLNQALSIWGHRATGLPVDCQVQRMTEANAEHDGERHALIHATRLRLDGRTWEERS